jgi:hypothetical protein
LGEVGLIKYIIKKIAKKAYTRKNPKKNLDERVGGDM